MQWKSHWAWHMGSAGTGTSSNNSDQRPSAVERQLQGISDKLSNQLGGKGNGRWRGANASRAAAVRVVVMARARIRRGATGVDRVSSIRTSLLRLETVAKGACQPAVTPSPSVLRKAMAASDPTWIGGPYMKSPCRT